MQVSSSRHMAWVSPVVRLTIDPSNPAQFARTLVRCATMRQPRLLINCEHQPCLSTHGVGHFVSHLLLLHHGGARVQLYNVSPTLFRLLHLLRLDAVFHVVSASGRQSDEADRRTNPVW